MTATVTERSGGLLPPALDLTPARRRLYEASLALFGQRGFHAVSVRDIVSELGLKPMALYAHVASKQELLLELVRIAYATHREAMSAALLETGSDPVEQIRALCEAHVRVHLAYPALARVANREVECVQGDHPDELARLRLEAARTFREVVVRGQRLGVFVDDDPLVLLPAIGSMGVSAPEWYDRSGGVGTDEVARLLADFAVRVLTAGARPA